jgi:hypothetical protein
MRKDSAIHNAVENDVDVQISPIEGGERRKRMKKRARTASAQKSDSMTRRLEKFARPNKNTQDR